MADHPHRDASLNTSSTAGGPRGRAGSGERRRSPRIPFSATAEIVELKTLARISGQTTDLGAGGCYVDTISQFPVGSQVKLRLTRANGSFEAQARVIYSQVGMGMGLAFTEIQPEQQALLREWLEPPTGEHAPRPADE